jgi:hypothetical protein
MTLIQFLIDTPVVAFLLLLGLLVTVVPLVMGLMSRKKPENPDNVGGPMKEPPTTRFLGTQMDIAILIFGIFLLLALIGWIRKTFFG